MEEALGQRVKLLRESLGLSQENLSKILTMDRSCLSSIENGRRELKAHELRQLSDAFSISIDELLDIRIPLEVVLEHAENSSGRESGMRVSVPAKNVEKFKEALLYILGKVGAMPNVGETVLYKLLYFIDFDYYEKYEEQLIGATYIKNNYGPTPVEFKAIVDKMIANEEVEAVDSKYYERPQKKYLPLREPDISVFSANEIKLIDEVLQRLSGMNAAAISEYSHRDVPWIVTPDKQQIDYESVFYRTPEYSVREYPDDGIQSS
ncbi:MAG: type II toxin-antitoxin system antitoxin SocA domain-containing protein [Chlamydiia bacterium]